MYVYTVRNEYPTIKKSMINICSLCITVFEIIKHKRRCSTYRHAQRALPIRSEFFPPSARNEEMKRTCVCPQVESPKPTNPSWPIGRSVRPLTTSTSLMLDLISVCIKEAQTLWYWGSTQKLWILPKAYHSRKGHESDGGGGNIRGRFK
jgi:hypothetical protein